MADGIFNLIVEIDDGRRVHYALNAQTVRLGRSAANQIRLSGSSISARHAELIRSATGFDLRDLGSKNGTNRNGRPLGKDSVALFDGDEILFGQTVKAHYVRVHEVGEPPDIMTDDDGEEPPAVNPVAAAVAKATRLPGRDR